MKANKEVAVEKFNKGYNCCQAVICAYCEELGVKEEDVFKLTEGFGLGMGGLRDTCGAVTGMFLTISLANSAICAYQIIRATEIIGLSHLEREMVASIVLYNSTPLDPYEELADRMDSHSYMIVAKLAAILRVANAMDRSHRQKFKHVKAVIKNKKLVITIESMDDIALEKGLLAAKAGIFEEIFGLKPVIREKRVYI